MDAQLLQNVGLVGGVALLLRVEEPAIDHGIGQRNCGNAGNVGAVFAVGHCVDVTLHQLEGITNGALRGGDDPLDEGRASPAAVHHGLLVHQSGIPLVVERPTVEFQHTGGHTCLRGLGAERFLAGGQSNGAPLLGGLNAAALCASDLAGSGCDHVDDLFQPSLIVASKLPLVDAEG